MESTARHEDALLVANCGACAVVQVKGRGSCTWGPELTKFCLGVLEKGIPQIVLDMSQCTGMDSTFMGVLAGVALKMRAKKHGEIVMINIAERHLELLQTLGLDLLIKTDQTALSAEAAEQVSKLTGATRLHTGASDRRTVFETMLTAHEDLVRANPDNLLEFQDVLTYLKKDLDKNTATSPG